MKAMVHTRYGSPDVVQLREVDKPVPNADELLIRVVATTVNRSDCGFRKPVPFFVRFFSGLRKPKRTILGSEFAGEIEAVGKDVTSFNVGDQVFGLTGGRFGAHAEYLCLPEAGIVATKPASITYEEAAAIPDGATLALSCLRKAGIQRGQDILIYGASGSIGTAGVQLAKHFGARVTAVAGTRNLDLVKTLGADEVIDYTTGDFTQSDATYDVVFDAVGKSSFRRCRALLKPGGVYMATDLGFLWHVPLLMLWTSRFGDKKAMLAIPKESKENLLLFKELIEAGELKPVIDRRYPLERIVEAYRYVETERKTGNVVITVGHD